MKLALFSCAAVALLAVVSAVPFNAYDAFTSRQWVNVGNNVTLNVGVNGNGSSVVILLHGFPEASGIWAPVIELMNSQNRHTIVFPDMRGYNRSSSPKVVGAYNIKNLVSDVDVLVNMYGRGAPVTLVGHDWGGIIAWVYAYTFPQKLSGLMILNSPHPTVFSTLIQTSPPQHQTAFTLRLLNYAALQAQMPDTVDPQMLAALVDAWQHGSVNAMLYYYTANFDTDNLLSWDNFNSTIPSPLVITVPTIVGWGMQDKIFISDLNLNPLSKYVKQLTISKYPTASHFPITDVPAAIVADIRKLIK